MCHSPWSQREHSKTLIHAWACLIPYPVGKLPGGPSKSWGDFSSLPLAVRPAVWPGRLWPWTAGRGMACRPGRRHPPPPPTPYLPAMLTESCWAGRHCNRFRSPPPFPQLPPPPACAPAGQTHAPLGEVTETKTQNNSVRGLCSLHSLPPPGPAGHCPRPRWYKQLRQRRIPTTLWASAGAGGTWRKPR